MRAMRIVGLVLAFMTAVAASAQMTSTKGRPSPKSDEAAVRAVYDGWAKAFRAHDLDGIMSFYAPGDEVVSYDIVPPLEYKGADAYRKDYAEFLAQYEGPIEVEYREMRVFVGGDVAFVHAIERMSGTLKGGQKSDMWLRATSGLKKINGKWRIVHDHISLPVDLETGKAATELKP